MRIRVTQTYLKPKISIGSVCKAENISDEWFLNVEATRKIVRRFVRNFCQEKAGDFGSLYIRKMDIGGRMVSFLCHWFSRCTSVHDLSIKKRIGSWFST